MKSSQIVSNGYSIKNKLVTLCVYIFSRSWRLEESPSDPSLHFHLHRARRWPTQQLITLSVVCETGSHPVAQASLSDDPRASESEC